MLYKKLFNNENIMFNSSDLLAIVDREVCLPVALAGHHISSWPAGPGTELSAGAAASQQTGSSVSPPDQLEPSLSQTDG